MKNILKAVTAGLLLSVGSQANAHFDDSLRTQPILVIGASYASAKVPFNERLQSPLFGAAVGNGSYLSLGDALIRKGFYVINEGQAGATTFERISCDFSTSCGPGYWDSYQTQVQRAFARVALPDGTFNSQYLLIAPANDCLHSGAFNVPQTDAIPCDSNEVAATMQRLIDVGELALSNGITPIYMDYPRYDQYDLPLTQQLLGFNWVVNETQYNEIRDTHEQMITTQIPDAIFVHNAWRQFEHVGDGLHPTDRAVRHATKMILRAIKH